MKYTLSKFDFIDGMQSEPNNPFSYNGLEIIWDFLNEYEQDASEEIEFDPVSFRCDFCEQTVKEIIYDYKLVVDNKLTDVEQQDFVLDYLHQKTTILGVTQEGTIVFQNF
jgi:hypothetical protein